MKNIEKAAQFYKAALDDGFLQAKKSLDRVYPNTIRFKVENPDY